MLQFAVYDEQGLAREWPIIGAHLLGPDDQVVAGDVTFEDGIIRCRKKGGGAVALCLCFDAGESGRLMLQTCLLPDRDEPYILSVELARHRIKLYLVKSEEWQMFEVRQDHPAIVNWEKARQLFTRSITTSDAVQADQAARQALTLGIEASERLAMAHAEILLHRRYGQRPASSTTLGVRIWPGRDSKPLKELLAREFDVFQIPLRWSHLEQEEGKYEWDLVDSWMKWGKASGKPLVAGPLLDFSKRALPKWMYVWQHDYDTCRDMAYDHLERVVQRYKDSVGMWNLAAGLSLNNNFQFTPEQMIDLVRMSSLLVRQTRPGARTMIEVVQPFGESTADHRHAQAPLLFVERLLQEGIRIDAVGVRLMFGTREPGLIARDLMQISSLLDRYQFLELPILVSAAGVPSEVVDAAGGSWRGEFSDAVQAKWGSRAFVVAISKPFVESMFWADLYDHDTAELPHSGLVTADGHTKSALQKLVALRKRLRKPLGAIKTSHMMPPPVFGSTGSSAEIR